MNRISIFYVFVLFAFFGCSNQKQTKFTFNKMLVEYAENPANIDIQNPRFSWIIKSTERNQSQSAHRIFVATDKNLLRVEKADIWDSGKISSSETIQHELEKPALQSNQKYYWKVLVWDGEGGRTTSSSLCFPAGPFPAWKTAASLWPWAARAIGGPGRVRMASCTPAGE